MINLFISGQTIRIRIPGIWVYYTIKAEPGSVNSVL